MPATIISEQRFDARLALLRAEFPRDEWSAEVAAIHGRKFRFDYASTPYKIAIEIEGGVFGRGKPCPVCKRKSAGAHSSVAGMLRDLEKYNEATAQGWRVLRFTPDQFDKRFDAVARLIVAAQEI